MDKKILALMTVAVLAATSCKKEGDATDTNKAAAPSGMLGTAAVKATASAAQAALPQPDPGKALSTYPELDSGEQLMFHYVAASALPPDLDKLAESYSSEYRQTTDTFRKRDLLQLLERCARADGVRLFIGEESGFAALDSYSLVTAPYGVGGRVLGVLGVIGPTRMAYERVIPVVQATARLISNAMQRG